MSLQDTLKLVKDALAAGKPELAKSISIATGLVFYDLQAPSKNLYPIITPLRNSIPRVGRVRAGDATHWKAIDAITGSGFNAMGWVPEGQRSGAMSYTTSNKSATYVTLGEEDAITFEAESAAVGFEDINATATMRLLQKMMTKEEMGILAGNATLNLGTPATPSTAVTGTGGTIPTNTYNVAVVALTQEGNANSSLAAGVATTLNVTGQDGKTYVLNGGSSNKSATAAQALTLGDNLTATTTVIKGAVAYAWFVGTAGNEKLEAITSINSLKLSAVAGTHQALAAVTADHSSNPNLAFDGLMTTAFNSTSAYNVQLATGTAGVGTKMTASGRGSVTEIDTMLKTMWDNFRVSPSVIYVNSQEQKSITDLVLTNASGPLLKYDVPTTPGQPYAIVAGGVVEYYYNPFSVSAGQKIPIKVHPNLSAGTLIGWCEQLPQWYQSNEVPNVAEVITRRDYYRIDWPLTTRQREYGVYSEEVLAVYAPFAMGTISNIAA